MQRVRSHQLDFVFADSPQGGKGADPSNAMEGKAYLLHTAKDRKMSDLTAPAVDSNRLLEAVAAEPNLAVALLNVARNKGAPGVDGRSVQEVVAESHRLLPKLRQELLWGRYRPGDIRRVWIPKPGGGCRGLGIPNVVDRWVQQAVLQVLEPIFEPTFHPSSHGFRPQRGARTAIAEAKTYVEQGHQFVVDLDLAKFFDRVPHQRLLGRMSRRVPDLRLLRLVRLMLNAKVVMPGGKRVCTPVGTPQGGPLSPLLSNIVLSELDWELQRRGHCFVRYADDCNVFVHSQRAGQRVMASIRRFIEGRLRLEVNERKSSVARPEEIHFLGFRLVQSQTGVEVHLSQRSLQRLDARIRELTPRTWGQSLGQCFEEVNRYLRGWIAYFRICTPEGAHALRRRDAHIRRRIRAIVLHQKKRGRYLFRHLRKRGVSAKAAAGAAYSRRGSWHRSNRPGMTRAYPNAWFHERLVSLWVQWAQLNAPAPVSDQRSLFDL